MYRQLIGSAVVALMALAAPTVQAQTGPGTGEGSCVTCVNVDEDYQDCAEVSGDGAEGCRIFYEMGARWCNWYGECSSNEFSALQVSAAGTVVASATRELANGLIVASCNSLIVAHARTSDATPTMWHVTAAVAPRAEDMEIRI